ncbi:hypothetical protein DFH08DRAFT_823060 [Mycena albidolilacea]|uniref:Uncharacterized protein n=1 Tax=Mycena albidolilacea TaxID=1033008 RepID=A0AAD6Z766_9AGAR|nr:hypothetical protein DFH08DRAFT_823060 [Mycena albidolilacea]
MLNMVISQIVRYDGTARSCFNRFSHFPTLLRSSGWKLFVVAHCPFTAIPALVIPGSQWIEPTDGSIMDGDDHASSTRADVLTGGGRWRKLDFSTPSLLGKRVRPVIPEVDGSSSDDAAEVQRSFFPSFNGEHSDDKEEIDGYQAHLLKRAEEFEQAAAIFRAQVPHRNRIWMSSMVKQDIGHNVGNLV